MKKLYIFLLIAIALTPLGLLTENPAWGEWESEEFEKMAGFIPQSIETTEPVVKAILPDYNLELIGTVPSYYLSALLGAILCIGIIWLMKPKQAN